MKSWVLCLFRIVDRKQTFLLANDVFDAYELSANVLRIPICFLDINGISFFQAMIRACRIYCAP